MKYIFQNFESKFNSQNMNSTWFFSWNDWNFRFQIFLIVFGSEKNPLGRRICKNVLKMRKTCTTKSIAVWLPSHGMEFFRFVFLARAENIQRYIAHVNFTLRIRLTLIYRKRPKQIAGIADDSLDTQQWFHPSYPNPRTQTTQKRYIFRPMRKLIYFETIFHPLRKLIRPTCIGSIVEGRAYIAYFNIDVMKKRKMWALAKTF